MSVLENLANILDLAQEDKMPMERQLARMRDRTSAGVDVDGVPFAPYASPDRDGQLVPLGAGAKLIDRARIDVVNSLSDVDLAGTIDGEAGAIACAQNRLRHFVGFSQRDGEEVVADFKEAMTRNIS